MADQVFQVIPPGTSAELGVYRARDATYYLEQESPGSHSRVNDDHIIIGESSGPVQFGL
jgi:hypothetical protein